MKMLRKQNLMKRLLCIALSLVLTAGFAPMRAQASDWNLKYNISTLKANTFSTIKPDYKNYNNNTKEYYLYKITVPANSYVKIKTNNKNNSLKIYKRFSKEKELHESDPAVSLSKKTSYYRVLPKGTYYIYNDNSANVRIKYTFTKVKNPGNYCKAKAYSLAAGKKRTLVFNYKYEFGRWFKIQLTKKKAITITSKYLDERDYSSHISVYDSYGHRIDTYELNNTTDRTQVLPKGTYYIRVSRLGYSDNDNGLYLARMCQFYWK